MNNLQKLLNSKNNLLNIYCTANYPEKGSTPIVIKELIKNGVDIIEIGLPYSDPIADGPTIQDSSKIAIENGFSIAQLFNDLSAVDFKTTPIILMGYLNQILKFGAKEFFTKAKETGVSGFIIPDLPLDEYHKEYAPLFKRLELSFCPLATNSSSKARLTSIDEACSGFIYLVSSKGTTGSIELKADVQEKYYKRISEYQLKNRALVGFGISSKSDFQLACKYQSGAIIGSAFIKACKAQENLEVAIKNFIKSIR